MTRQELVEMVGNEDQANLALELLLKSVRPAMIKTIIHAEIESVNKKLDEYREADFVSHYNGSDHVNWMMENKPYEDAGCTVFNAPVSVNAQSEFNRKLCEEAEALLYSRNRLTSMICAR